MVSVNRFHLYWCLREQGTTTVSEIWEVVLKVFCFEVKWVGKDEKNTTSKLLLFQKSSPQNSAYTNLLDIYLRKVWGFISFKKKQLQNLFIMNRVFLKIK